MKATWERQQDQDSAAIQASWQQVMVIAEMGGREAGVRCEKARALYADAPWDFKQEDSRRSSTMLWLSMGGGYRMPPRAFLPNIVSSFFPFMGGCVIHT